MTTRAPVRTVDMMNFRLEMGHAGPRRVISLFGECDIATAPRLKDAIWPLTGGGTDELILDLSGLDFLDSSGLGVIVGAHKRLRESGGVLKLAGPQGPALKVLQLTGLDKVIPIFEDLAAAGA